MTLDWDVLNSRAGLTIVDTSSPTETTTMKMPTEMSGTKPRPMPAPRQMPPTTPAMPVKNFLCGVIISYITIMSKFINF
jgi:hypothetical protein